VIYKGGGKTEWLLLVLRQGDVRMDTCCQGLSPGVCQLLGSWEGWGRSRRACRVGWKPRARGGTEIPSCCHGAGTRDPRDASERDALLQSATFPCSAAETRGPPRGNPWPRQVRTLFSFLSFPAFLCFDHLLCRDSRYNQRLRRAVRYAAYLARGFCVLVPLQMSTED